MNPVLENALIAAIVMGAFGYFLAGVIRRRRAGKGCSDGCGCVPAAKLIPADPKR